MLATSRERLIETALRLFNKHGFHATGVDRIVSESGVTKKTLYAHFKSKEELILAVVRRRDEAFRNWLMREVERRTSDPVNQMLACFDVIGEWVRSKDFYGCLCTNASVEFADSADPIHAAAAEHKRLVLSFLRQLATAAGAADADALARRLHLLLDGAMVMAHVTGRAEAVDEAHEAAEVLIRAALKSPGS